MSVRGDGVDPVPSGIDALVVAYADRRAADDDVLVLAGEQDDIESLAVFTDQSDRLSILRP